MHDNKNKLKFKSISIYSLMGKLNKKKPLERRTLDRKICSSSLSSSRILYHIRYT